MWHLDRVSRGILLVLLRPLRASRQSLYTPPTPCRLGACVRVTFRYVLSHTVRSSRAGIPRGLAPQGCGGDSRVALGRSRREWVRGLPCTVYQIARALGSPPRGLAVGFPQSSRHGRRSPVWSSRHLSHTPGTHPHSRGGRVPHGPTVRLAGRPAPLRPLGLSFTGVLSNLSLTQRIPPATPWRGG